MGDCAIPLYTAPQPLTTSERAELENYRNAQQVVPEWTNEQCLEFLSIAFRHAEIKGDLEMDDIRLGVKMVNSCRAAMLQGAEPVSNRDELPLDYLQGHKDGLEWAALLAEANHPQTGDWLYDDPIALAAAIRKGPDMPELKSASADEDDNFYSWFGRFWLENYQQNNYTTSAKQMLGTMAEFAFRAGRESATQAGNSPVIPDGLNIRAVAALREAVRNQWLKSDEFAEKIYWKNMHDIANEIVVAMLAGAPQQEMKP